ncbi:U-box domain-containing protein 33-like isoform X1 [Pistacia vera]|uniref:U-box domain-containing protein 33-like isoform X1 n=1 Tax=Pistacia vera TaxID=55513 RepID=UPI001262CFF9|nr:U-box domain-containing protein 33-like isoform X1 [Pistacia vera]
MEVLREAQRPHHQLSGILFSRKVSSCQLPEIVEEDSNEKVYVAVGKGVEKSVSLLHWSFKRFGSGREFCILHVHQPSPLIPTLLGKLPASQASPEVVSAFRMKERDEMKHLLDYYLSVCSEVKVNASIITTEADQVQKAIIELANIHGIRKLVIGAVPENCMKVKKSSSKAYYASKNAPLSCELWFVNKGKLVWMREASEGPSSLPSCNQAETLTAETLRSRSLQYHNTASSFPSENFRSRSTTSIKSAPITDWIQTEPIYISPMSPTLSGSVSGCFPHYDQSLLRTRSSTSSGYTSAERISTDSDSKFEEDSLWGRLREASLEAEELRNQAYVELLKCKNLELEAMEAISKVKVFESAHAREVKLRKEAEDALGTMIQEQEVLLEEKEKVTGELHKTMRNVALLDSRAQEANRRRDQAAGELKFIQTSIATLQQEKQRLRQQKMEAVRWLERWRSRGQAGATNCNGFIGFVEDLPESAEFSLADLQTATCDFSESFKLGEGGFGCVYKGEMLGRTVAIKTLHPHNMQGQSEFQQEVRVLSKLQHPHLVTLLGACPEAWALVYEYLPKGSLQDCVFRKSNISPLTWKDRARIAAEIASALCFLHSSKPEKIVHGDLKLQNILLDSELSCKICDFGICRLLTEESLCYPSFNRGSVPKGAFPYADPEFHRNGVLTPKTDIYSFGVIILQLLTGRLPLGLVAEVRKAVSCGNWTSILDSSAGDWPTFVARRLLDLGLQCCELYGRDRPDLTPTLVRELEQLHVTEERPVPSFFLCPILQEIMHDPQVAADGFTYEGKALRDWLENGRETSPMTNLKLSHLQLTPNHALRLAIQDWLCRS